MSKLFIVILVIIFAYVSCNENCYIFY